MNKKRLISIALGLVTALVLWKVLPPGRQLWGGIASLPLWVWAGALSGMVLSYSMRALRMRDEWAGRAQMRWRDGLYLTLLHSAAINLLPMRAGEAGYPWLLQRHWRVPLLESAASLFWLRVQDAGVLGVLALVWFGPGAGMGGLLLRLGLAAVALLTLALGGHVLARWALARWPSPARWVKPWRIARGLVESALRAPARGWLWSLLHWTGKIGGLGLIVAHLTGQPWLLAFGGALAAEGATALPLSPPAGFGNYEAGVWLGLHSLGADLAMATVLGAALVAHVFLLLIAVAAAGICPWLMPPLADEASPKRPTQATDAAKGASV